MALVTELVECGGIEDVDDGELADLLLAEHAEGHGLRLNNNVSRSHEVLRQGKVSNKGTPCSACHSQTPCPISSMVTFATYEVNKYICYLLAIREL